MPTIGCVVPESYLASRYPNVPCQPYAIGVTLVDHLIRIVVYIFFFLAAVGSFIAAARGSGHGQNQARWKLVILLSAGLVGGAGLGALLGMLSPVEHSLIAGAAGFGTAGFFGGMILALRQIAAHPESTSKPPSKVTVATIVSGSLLGALAGLWLPMFVADLEAPFMFSFLLALGGAAFGALSGFAYEQPLIGGGLLGLFLFSGVIGLTVGWLQDDDDRQAQRSTKRNSSAAPRITIWDKMYDRRKLLADLTSDRPGAALQAVPILWLQAAGGPQFRRPDQPEGRTLRETFAQQEPYSGIWTAEVDRYGQTLRLEFDFAADSDRCTLTVLQSDGSTTVDQGTFKVDGTKITISDKRGTLTLDLSGDRAN